MFWQVGGAVLTATGIWALMNGEPFIRVLAPFMADYILHANVPVLCITFGLIMVVLGFLGCCGAQKESKCLLIMVKLIITLLISREHYILLVCLIKICAFPFFCIATAFSCDLKHCAIT